MNKIDESFEYNFSIDILKELFKEKIYPKNIIGIDRVNNKSFKKDLSKNLDFLQSKIESGNYKYAPYLERLYLKDRNKLPRLISVPTLRDRIVLCALKNILHQLYEDAVCTDLVNSQIKRINEVLKDLSDRKEIRIFKFDINSFYNSINQEKLLNMIQQRVQNQKVLDLIKDAIQNPTVAKKYDRKLKSEYFNFVGVPQGLAISNILASIYLMDFDKAISENTLYYNRYVDDILIIDLKENIIKLKSNINYKLNEKNLSINKEKSNIYEKTDRFTYLGYLFEIPKLTIGSPNVQNHIDSFFSMLCYYSRLLENKNLRPKWLNDDLLIQRIESDINEKITGAISNNYKYGWVFYFNAITETAVFHRLNKIIDNAIHRVFPKKMAKKIGMKSYVRSYYEIKHHPKGGYIHNYDVYETLVQKIDYLQFRGYLDNNQKYSEEEINYLFNDIRENNLSKLNHDPGRLS